MKYLPLNPQIFITNRARFIKEMAPNSIAIFNSNDELPINADAMHKFKQNSNFFGIRGIGKKKASMIILPKTPEKNFRKELVSFRPKDKKKKWDGKRLRKEEAT